MFSKMFSKKFSKKVLKKKVLEKKIAQKKQALLKLKKQDGERRWGRERHNHQLRYYYEVSP